MKTRTKLGAAKSAALVQRPGKRAVLELGGVLGAKSWSDSRKTQQVRPRAPPVPTGPT